MERTTTPLKGDICTTCVKPLSILERYILCRTETSPTDARTHQIVRVYRPTFGTLNLVWGSFQLCGSTRGCRKTVFLSRVHADIYQYLRTCVRVSSFKFGYLQIYPINRHHPNTFLLHTSRDTQEQDTVLLSLFPTGEESKYAVCETGSLPLTLWVLCAYLS